MIHQIDSRIIQIRIPCAPYSIALSNGGTLVPWWRKLRRLARWCHLFPRSAYSALNEIIVTAARTCRAMRIDIPNHRPEVRMRVRGCLAFTPSMRFDRPNETFSCCRYDNDARQRTTTTLSMYRAKIYRWLPSVVSLSIYQSILGETRRYSLFADQIINNRKFFY